ncbi:MAG: hypothetical protein LC798_13435 [Chloroflexi bacterium]|nr:hypothetical protein [Chloroflexota bacterium]
MALLTPAYRVTVYELDGSTVLTPRAGAPHSEPFKVATHAGVVGFRPYLNFPRGRRSRIDLLSRRADIGELTLDLVDARLVSGGSNVDRWVTAFVGDTDGRQLFLGKQVFVEESMDGSAWLPFLSGTVQDINLGSRVKMQLSVRENGESMKAEVFVGRPHPSITYADSSSVMPLGPAIAYGGYPATPRVPATVKAWSISGHGSGSYLITRKAAIVTDDLYTMLTQVREPLLSLLQKEPHYLTKGDNLSKAHPDLQVDVFAAGGGARLGTYAVVRQPWTFFGKAFLAYMHLTDGIEDTKNVRTIGIALLPAADPRYAAIPAVETDVEFRVMLSSAPTNDAPIYVSDKRPATIAKDVLAGMFGRFKASGDPYRVMPANAASFAAREADGTIPNARFRITEKSDANKFIEEQICKVFSYVYRFNGSGEVELIDTRLPATSAGLLTITNDDLTSDAPGWGADISGSIGITRIGYYIDSQEKPGLIRVGGYQGIGAQKPTWVFARGGLDELTVEAFLTENAGFGRSAPYEVDAKGLRYSMDVEDRATLPFTEIEQRVRVPLYMSALTEVMRSLFSGGLAETTLRCLRTSNTEACMPGDLRIVDVDEIPNAASNRRGGPRLARCLERTEEGPALLLRFVDMGANVIATSPTIGSPSLVSGREGEAVQATMTLNAQGEPAVMWVAVTSVATGSAPANDDGRWMFGARAVASGALVVGGMPSGSRIWVRARSEPIGEGAMKLPSPWVQPSGTKFIDTTGLSAPTGLSIILNAGSEVHVGFTPGSTTYPTEMYVDGTRFDKLPPGSTLAVFRGLSTGGHTLGLKHVDDRGGASSLTTIAVTVGAVTMAPDMVGIGLVVGVPG